VVDLRRLATPSAATTVAARPAIARVGWHKLAIGGAIGAVATVLLLVAFNAGGLRERLLGRSSATLEIRSLAVLPLENLSGDPTQEYFADGMTDELITNLAQISVLKVISRTSAMRYKGTKKSLSEIAQELHVDAVVGGSVMRVGDRVRITAQLIEAPTDRHLWAASYERDLRDVLSMQDEVTRAIVSEIRVKLTAQEQARLASTRPINPEAYQLYLKGRYHWYKRSPESLNKSLQYFQEAIEKDPNYASAYAGMAESYNQLGWALYGVQPPREAFPRAKSAARRALEIDDRQAEAYAALAWAAYVYDWDWQTADREFKRALELNPRYAPAHMWYSHYLETVGRSEESFAESKRALDADPLGLIINLHLGWYYLFARKYDLAIEQLQKTLELDPSFILARMFLGQAYQQKGMMEEAIREFQEAVNLSERNPVYLGDLGHAYALAAKRREAMGVLEELKKLSRQRYVPARAIAEVYIGLGEKDEAFFWLRKAFEERDGWLVHLRGDPRYDPLRSDPHFQDLLRRMNFPP
jgi:TolB-like protein/tetratricopeptide (TPR) repeat protein